MLPEGVRPDRFYEVKRNAQGMSLLLSSYDLLITINQARIKIGRFSTSALGHLSLSSDSENFRGQILTIGAMCDFAKTCVIVVGGDHHQNIFNVTLNSSSIIKMAMDADNLALAGVSSIRPIVIGDNVVVSERAVILGGVQIGDRAVIGAGAVASGNCDAFWSHGGVPAKPLRQALTPEHQELFRQANMANVAAHCLHTLPKLAKELMDGRISLDDYKRSLQFLPARPEIHLTASVNPQTEAITFGQIGGFSVGGRMVTDESKLKALNEYFAQIGSGSETLKWCPDVFWALNLY